VTSNSAFDTDTVNSNVRPLVHGPDAYANNTNYRGTLMRTLSFLLLSLVFVGCAMTYEQPKTVAQVIRAPVGGTKPDVLRISKQVLVAQGFQITNSDDSAGVISTAPRNLRVTPDQADCGTTMGIDYLKDNRTTTRVAFGIIAEDAQVNVKANIEGEYKPGAVDQNITLTCVSRGVLERDILTKILAAAPK
jgi:hypothetical protein